MTRRTLFLPGLTGLAGCHRDVRPRLNVFNWSAYVAPDTIPNFEREYAVRVRYSVYESNEEMFARVMTGNSGWDVAFPTSYFIEPMRDSGLLATLDHRMLPRLDNLLPLFRHPPWDPNLQWGVPYMWNATGICYSAKLTFSPDSWAGLWDPRLAGRMTMLDDPVDVFAAALKKLGHSINTRREEHIRAAGDEALSQKRLLRAYGNAEVRDQLVAGDVLASQMWSTTAQQAIDESKDLRFVYPKEGFAIYPDVAVVLRESPRKELAHKFLDYLLRPQVAAGIVMGARTATANGAAHATLPAAIRDNPTIYPNAETMARGEWALTASPEIQRLRDWLWTRIKAA